MPTLEDLLTLSEAGRIVPGGPVSPISVWRWCREGLKSPDGHRAVLKSYKVGRKLCTTRADLIEFFAAAGQYQLGKYLNSKNEAPHTPKPVEKKQGLLTY